MDSDHNAAGGAEVEDASPTGPTSWFQIVVFTPLFAIAGVYALVVGEYAVGLCLLVVAALGVATTLHYQPWRRRRQPYADDAYPGGDDGQR